MILGENKQTEINLYAIDLNVIPIKHAVRRCMGVHGASIKPCLQFIGTAWLKWVPVSAFCRAPSTNIKAEHG